MENNNNDNIDVLNALINKVVNLENKLIEEIAEVKTILIKDTITKEMLDHDKKQLRNIGMWFNTLSGFIKEDSKISTQRVNNNTNHMYEDLKTIISSQFEKQPTSKFKLEDIIYSIVNLAFLIMLLLIYFNIDSSIKLQRRSLENQEIIFTTIKKNEKCNMIIEDVLTQKKNNKVKKIEKIEGK